MILQGSRITLNCGGQRISFFFEEWNIILIGPLNINILYNIAIMLASTNKQTNKQTIHLLCFQGSTQIHSQSFTKNTSTQINKQTNNQSIYLFYFFRGRLKSVKYANTQPMCVDHLQRDEAHKLKPYILGQYQCHTFVGNSQYFTFSKG